MLHGCDDLWDVHILYGAPRSESRLCSQLPGEALIELLTPGFSLARPKLLGVFRKLN